MSSQEVSQIVYANHNIWNSVLISQIQILSVLLKHFPLQREILIYDGIQHVSQCFKMLDTLKMASLDEILDAKDLISKEVICQENP